MKKSVKHALNGLVCAVTMLLGFAACSTGSDSSIPFIPGVGGSKGDGLPAGGEYLPFESAEAKPEWTTSGAAGSITLDGVTKSSIQAALTDAGTSGSHEIVLGAGFYDLGEGQLTYNGSGTIKIKGSDTTAYGAKTVIYTMNHDLTSEQSRSLLSFKGTGNLILENVTLWCAWTPTILDSFTSDDQKTKEQKGDAQLETVGYDGSGYCAAYNCSFKSYQDTLRTTGKAWFYNCYVEGDVDFLWMEVSGKVALYENCRIRSIGGRTKWNSTYTKKSAVAAYLTAPRVDRVAGASYYKGLVIFNSKIEAENPETYLGRSPWMNSGDSIYKENAYYNNVSIVGCTYYGSLKSPWQKPGAASRDIIFSGFNTDSYFPASPNGRRYSAETVEKEFAGRNNIFNRYFEGDTEKVMIVPKSERWDATAFAAAQGWNVTADESKALLDGEVEANIYSYNFVNGKNGTFTTDDALVTVTTTNNNNGQHGVVLSTNNTITLKVARACKITINGCQFGNGTMTLSNGENVIATENNKTATDGAGIDFVYQGNEEATLTLKSTGTCYIHGITIREFTEFVPVTRIVLSGTNSILERGVTQFTATLSPAKPTLKAVAWSSSDTGVAVVDANGKIQGVGVGSAVIECAATDGSGVKATRTVTVRANTTKPVAGRTYDYNLIGGVGNPYFSADTFFQLYGKGDNGGHGIIVTGGSHADLRVAGNSKITLYTCAYDNPGTINVTKANGDTVGTIDVPAGDGSNDKTTKEIIYVGGADVLKFDWIADKQLYLHELKVEPLAASDLVKATAITITAAGGATSVDMGADLQLTASITPDNATVKAVAWSSSDTSKAVVDSNGLVTGVGAGDVTITATATDGSEVTGTYNLTIISKAVTVTWDFNKKTTTAIAGTKIAGEKFVIGDGTSGINMLVDATAGQFWQRNTEGNDAVLSAGTKLYIPVSKGSVVSYTGNWKTDCYVDGVDMNESTSFTSEPATEAGFVVIEAKSNNCYFCTISVTNILPSDYIVEEQVWDFHNITTSLASDGKITGEVKSITDGSLVGLVVDATNENGQAWQRTSGDFLLSAGTTLKVPVSKGSVVSYTGNWKTDCFVDGVDMNESTSFTSAPATEAGYVTIVAKSGNCYFYSIKVTNVNALEWRD